MKPRSEEHCKKISESKRGKKLSQEHIEKIRAGVIKAYSNPEVKEKQKFNTSRGENHPMFGKEGIFLGRKHTEETKKKMSIKQKGVNHPMHGKKHKEESKIKISDSCKKWWKTEDGFKAKTKQSEMMNSGLSSYANSFISNPSKPQINLFSMVKSIFPSAEMNYPFFNYSLDIAIPDQRIVIEYDGSYWHQDKEYDKRRQKYLENHKWKFIKYVDILPSNEQLENDIKNIICNKGT